VLSDRAHHFAFVYMLFFFFFFFFFLSDSKVGIVWYGPELMSAKAKMKLQR